MPLTENLSISQRDFVFVSAAKSRSQLSPSVLVLLAARQVPSGCSMQLMRQSRTVHQRTSGKSEHNEVWGGDTLVFDK